MSTATRRTVVRTGAWSVPGIALAVAAPAAAHHSGETCVLKSAVARKCPGKSSHNGETYWTTVITLTFSEPVESLTVVNATLNDNSWTNPPVKIDCNSSAVQYVLLEHTDSEHASGIVTFSVNGLPAQTTVFYADNHPLHGYPCTGDC